MIKFNGRDEAGYYKLEIGDFWSELKFTTSPFSFFLTGQSSYSLLGYWDLTPSRSNKYTSHMYNIWIECDDGIAFWDEVLQEIQEIPISTTQNMVFKDLPRNSISPGFYAYYRKKGNGFERPIIVNSGETDSLMNYLRDHSDGKPMTFIELHLHSWHKNRPRVLDTSNNGLTYVARGSGTAGINEIPWAIPAGVQKTAILRVKTDGSEGGGGHDVTYGDDAVIANYLSNRSNDENKVGKITPAFTGRGYWLYIVHADPSAKPFSMSLDRLYNTLVVDSGTEGEDELLGVDNRFIAA